MQKKPLSFIWNYTKDFKYKLLFVVFLTLLGRFSMQIGAYYSAKMFSFAGTQQHDSKYWETIILFIMIFVVVDLVGHLLQSWSLYIMGQIIPHIRSVVIKDTFDFQTNIFLHYSFYFISIVALLILLNFNISRHLFFIIENKRFSGIFCNEKARKLNINGSFCELHSGEGFGFIICL